jgi:hypothetical protein
VRPEDTLELTYCRAFALALRARSQRDDNRREDALRTLQTALRELDPVMQSARAAGHARLAELYTQLDKDLSEMEEGRR